MFFFLGLSLEFIFKCYFFFARGLSLECVLGVFFLKPPVL